MALPGLSGRSRRQAGARRRRAPPTEECRRGSRSRRSGRGHPARPRERKFRSWPSEVRAATSRSPVLVRRAGAGVRLPGGRIRAPGSIDHRGDERRAVALGEPVRSIPITSLSLVCSVTGLLSWAMRRGCVDAVEAGRVPGRHGRCRSRHRMPTRPGPGPRRGDRLRRRPRPVDPGWSRSPRRVAGAPPVSRGEVRGDERVELGPQQPDVRADQLGEHRRGCRRARCRRARRQGGRVPAGRVRGHRSCRSPPGVAVRASRVVRFRR